MKDETKMWKYNQNDLKERVYWNQYMTAYGDAINKCSNVPWYVIPADQNWYRDFLISDRVANELKKLNMKYPGLKKITE
jgi:polyphosphate kinase 2 (PPK2 family)